MMCRLDLEFNLPTPAIRPQPSYAGQFEVAHRLRRNTLTSSNLKYHPIAPKQNKPAMTASTIRLTTVPLCAYLLQDRPPLRFGIKI